MPLVDRKTVESRISDAIAAVLEETPPLDFTNIHERTVAHRLACALEQSMDGWNIDCEYNRDVDLIKVLQGFDACAGTFRSGRVFPDVVVHQRRAVGRENNLLVIEMKSDMHEDECDFRKLILFTDPNGRYQYQYGLFINVAGGTFECTWFIDGAPQ